MTYVKTATVISMVYKNKVRSYLERARFTEILCRQRINGKDARGAEDPPGLRIHGRGSKLHKIPT
jgi:hypothetical protein